MAIEMAQKEGNFFFFTAKADFPMRTELGLKLKQRLNDRTWPECNIKLEAVRIHQS